MSKDNYDPSTTSVNFEVFFNGNWTELGKELDDRLTGLLIGSRGMEGENALGGHGDALSAWQEWHGREDEPSQWSMTKTLAYLAQLEEAVSRLPHEKNCTSRVWGKHSTKRRCDCIKRIVYTKDVKFDE